MVHPYQKKPPSPPSPTGEGVLKSFPPWGKKKGGKNFTESKDIFLVT
jgi:hypothetical protein